MTENNDRDKFESTQNTEAIKSDKFTVFVEWLKANGAKLGKLELRDYGNEVRGCHATEQINDDETIIEIPLKCLITIEMGKETEIGRVILDANLDLDAPKHVFLMVFMLVDRMDPNSFFKPYYDILPGTLSNMPIFWNEQELGYLTGSYLLEQIAERNAAIAADYEAICAIAPHFRSYATLEEFKWARTAVCSRNFGMIVNGVSTAALVPYADMLNHYRPRETKWQFDNELQSFTVISLQEISCGAQVYDSYGRKCNHRFLLNYGFSVENNVEYDGTCPNETPFRLSLDPSDPLHDLKLAYYRRDLSGGPRLIRAGVGENESSRLLFAYLRLIEADNEDVEQLISCSGSSLYRSVRDAQVPISLENETRALFRMVKLCDSMLAGYTSTLAQDIERLTHGNVPQFSNERNALIQVKGEKEVLHFYKDLAETGLWLLKAIDVDDFEQRLVTLRGSKHSMALQYYRGSLARLVTAAQRRNDKRRGDSKPLDLSKPTVV